MSRHGEITVTLGDGEHTLRLPIDGVRELQEKTKKGPVAIYRGLLDGTWMFDDMRETIRIGLIHGGMKPVDALAFMSRYIDTQPWMIGVIPAAMLLDAALSGPKGDDETGSDDEDESDEALKKKVLTG